jgi:hypothetical protein
MFAMCIVLGRWRRLRDNASTLEMPATGRPMTDDDEAMRLAADRQSVVTKVRTFTRAFLLWLKERVPSAGRGMNRRTGTPFLKAIS